MDAAFSAAISYINRPERTARSLSDLCAVKKQPAMEPTAQPVWLFVSFYRGVDERNKTYSCYLTKEFVAIFNSNHSFTVTEVVDSSCHEHNVSYEVECQLNPIKHKKETTYVASVPSS